MMRLPVYRGSVVTQRLKKRAAGAGATLIKMQGAERYSAGIIDGYLDELPASTVRALLAVARHTVAGLAKAPKFFLDVQMQQIARLGVFVAQHRCRRLQLCQVMQAELLEATCHRADGQAQVVGDLSIGLACPTLFDKAIKQGVWGGMRAAPRLR